MAKEIFQREENVKPVKAPVIVVGDGETKENFTREAFTRLLPPRLQLACI